MEENGVIVHHQDFFLLTNLLDGRVYLLSDSSYGFGSKGKGGSRRDWRNGREKKNRLLPRAVPELSEYSNNFFHVEFEAIRGSKVAVSPDIIRSEFEKDKIRTFSIQGLFVFLKELQIFARGMPTPPIVQNFCFYSFPL